MSKKGLAKWVIPLGFLIAYLTGAGSLTDFLASFGQAVQGHSLAASSPEVVQ